MLWKTEIVENRSEVLGHFGGLDSSDELCLGRGRGDNRLEFGAVCDGATAECECETGDGAAGRGVRAIGGVDVADKFVWRCVGGERGERAVDGVEKLIGAGWESRQRWVASTGCRGG
jgi:hypothetical protein